MIRALKTNEEVQLAVNHLKARNLPLHLTPQKNWDHFLLSELVASLPRDIQILDSGSGGGQTLQFLNKMGFKNLKGIDLVVPKLSVMKRIKEMLPFGGFPSEPVIEQGDICDTHYPDESFDLITSISVIEHDVNIPRFVKDVARILRPNGLFFITFDYWPSTERFESDPKKVCGLPWNILSEKKVREFLKDAAATGLDPVELSDIPSATEPVVQYAGREYTFMAVALRKRR